MNRKIVLKLKKYLWSNKKVKQDFSVSFDKELKISSVKINNIPNIRPGKIIEYNQAKSNYTKKACFLYSYFTMVSNIYGIKFSKSFLLSTLKEAEIKGIYNSLKGAKFSKSFSYMSSIISGIIGIKVKQYFTTIDSENFNMMLDKGYVFVIGTKKANKQYFNEIKDGDIDDLEYGSGKIKGHLQCYYKDLINGKYYIIENYKGFLNDNTIEFELSKLKRAYIKKMYYSSVKTIIPILTNKNIQKFNNIQKNKKVGYFNILNYFIKSI